MMKRPFLSAGGASFVRVLAACAVVAACVPVTAFAADRVVLVEEFTDTG